MSQPEARRPVGMTAIITYKFVKAPISLSIAVALTFAPALAYAEVMHLIAQMSELGLLMARVAHWLRHHLSQDLTSRAALLAWLDGLSTGIEGILLATGKGWAEWVVVAVLACLVPFELVGFIRHTTPLRAIVLVVNVLVVAYLAWRRLEAERAHLRARHSHEPPPPSPEG